MPRLLQTFDAQGNPVARDATPVEEANIVSLIGKANAALATNVTFLAIPSPSAAQVSAQSKALTRQMNALIRLQLSLTATITDT